MDSQRKDIQELTAQLDGKREELAAFYRLFGEKLLKDSSGSGAYAGPVQGERVSSWRRLMMSRESDNRTILEIKAAVVRQQELLSFRKELDSALETENARQHEQFEKLGSVFFAHYSADRDEEYFGVAWKDAAKEGDALARLEEKHDVLKGALSGTNFFARTFGQFKLAGLASGIRSHRVRIQKILADGAQTLVQSGALDRRVQSGDCEPELSELYSGLRETAARLVDLRARADSLGTDLESVSDTLSACGASVNPSRRIEELHARVRETDRRIDALTALCAREYSDKFLDEDGRSLLGGTVDGNSFSDMGAYSFQLEKVAGFRAETAAVRRRIEMLETSLRIESLDRSIASSARNIEEYERKIDELKRLAADMRKSIKEAERERAKLVERRDDMKRRFGDSASD
jgi:chromosome segregation ATPase